MYSLEAIDRIRNRDKKDPLFLYLAFQSVHSANPPEYPLQPPSGWLSKFAHIKHDGRRRYAAMMGAMDVAVGRVCNAMRFVTSLTARVVFQLPSVIQ